MAVATIYCTALTAYRSHHTDRIDGGILGSVRVFLSPLCSSKPRDGLTEVTGIIVRYHAFGGSLLEDYIATDTVYIH